VIADPARRGEALAEFALAATGRLWNELVEAGEFASDATAARHAWECFALYACVRGLVEAGGFNRETAAAIDAFHERVLESWRGESAESLDARRARAAERYAEYGAIGQAGGASGAATVTARLGEGCVRHLIVVSSPRDATSGRELAELIGGLHESLMQASAEAVRSAT